MKSSAGKLIFQHFLKTFIVILIFTIIINLPALYNFDYKSEYFILKNIVYTPLICLTYFIMAAIPIILFYIFLYKFKFDKKRTIFFKILVTAIVPIIIYLDAYFKTDNWRIIFGHLISFSNLLVLGFNQVLFEKLSKK
jgi:hypothetical protein